MKYSFIKPREKNFLSLFSKIWVVFISLMVLFMLAFNFYMVVEVKFFKQGVVELVLQREELEHRIDQDEENIGIILRQKVLSEEVFSNNTLLKESMKNLFDLVPDQITLKKVQMERNSLVLYGVTPTQDAFNLLLAAPLKSIFHTSNTTFHLTSEGWYNFMSINKILGMDGVRE